ncbi:MAG TPA: hypothetical protein VLF88_03225 [Candidatus Babeliales bacterium]|nr:hypothetical protein [Candidatus Babeliales bacterium]
MAEVTETQFSYNQTEQDFQVDESVLDSLSEYHLRAGFEADIQDPTGMLEVGTVLKDPECMDLPRKIVLRIYQSPKGELVAALNFEGTIVLIGVLLYEIHERLQDGTLLIDGQVAIGI